VPVILGGLGPCLRQVRDLMGVPRPEIPRAGQVGAAGAAALREARDRLVRVVAPLQVRARRTGLLAGLTLLAALRPELRRGPPGWSSPLGGIEEFPEFREISRSSRAIFSACSATWAASSVVSASSSAT